MARTVLPYVTVSVQTDVILTELQQHPFQRWTASSSALWTSSPNSGLLQTPWFCLCTLNTGCNVG